MDESSHSSGYPSSAKQSAASDANALAHADGWVTLQVLIALKHGVSVLAGPGSSLSIAISQDVETHSGELPSSWTIRATLPEGIQRRPHQQEEGRES